MKKERKYGIDVRSYYPSYEELYNTSKNFGHFSPDGKTYTITDQNTPRQWMNLLFNDKFGSIITNKGEGYNAYGRFTMRVTRYYNPELYLPRELDGARILEVRDDDTGAVINLFNSNNITCKVTPGCSEFTGEEDGIKFKVRVFVPRNDSCECWMVELKNVGDTARRLTVYAQQTWAFHNNSRWGKYQPSENVEIEDSKNGFYATATSLGKPFDTLYGAFEIEGCTNSYKEIKGEQTLCSSKRDPETYRWFTYRYVNLFSSLEILPEETATRTVVSAVSESKQETVDCAAKYTDTANAEKSYQEVIAYWEKELSYNTCRLPDKNMERFLNVWLKYQLALTYIYNRAEYNGGYRDVVQDSWGAMAIHPEHYKARMIEAMVYIYKDGHGIRSYDSVAGIAMDEHFVDCPLWMPCTVSQYIRETGDYAILDAKVPYIDSDETETIEQHLWKLLEYPYTHRGANGLVLMYDGDWLDGLTGINQNGTATSAWATAQAYWAQNFMIEIYEAVGETDKAEILKQRNAEYKKIFREVAWDGKWYVYGFKSDGLPVGSSKCAEGKIYLNPNTWAIFTGIEDDPKRIELIRHSINTYLTTPYGSLLLYPPYVNDTTCGRIGGQLPGTFANSAVYLHAATFEVFAKTKIGANNEAQDLFMRLLPNHPDNPDCRRTSEPYCTGNVHFGPNNECYGMNLFSWFTATPAWLIHGGFDEILGVKAQFDGLKIIPCVPDEWDGYEVKRLYRGREYHLTFRKSNDNKGIYANNEFVGLDFIPLSHPADTFEILY